MLYTPEESLKSSAIPVGMFESWPQSLASLLLGTVFLSQKNKEK